MKGQLSIVQCLHAIHIRDMIFKIEGNVPETETWAFLPGEIVECKYHKFIDGKAELTTFRSLSFDELDRL